MKQATSLHIHPSSNNNYHDVAMRTKCDGCIMGKVLTSKNKMRCDEMRCDENETRNDRTSDVEYVMRDSAVSCAVYDHG